MSQVKDHFDDIAEEYDYFKKRNKFYYDNLKFLLKKIIPPNKIVLEIGCGTGDLLASVKPKIGYGIDISSKMIKIAKSKFKKNKHLHFSGSYATDFKGKNLDYIFLSDVIEHLEEPEKMFKDVSQIMIDKTKLVITMANPIWEPALWVWEKLSWKMREGPHRRLKFNEIGKLLEIFNLKIETHDYFLLIPVKIPFFTDFANKYLEKVFKKYAFIEYIVATKL